MVIPKARSFKAQTHATVGNRLTENVSREDLKRVPGKVSQETNNCRPGQNGETGRTVKLTPGLHPQLAESTFSSPAMHRNMLIPHNKTFHPAHQCLQNIIIIYLFIFTLCSPESAGPKYVSDKAAARIDRTKQLQATACGCLFFFSP